MILTPELREEWDREVSSQQMVVDTLPNPCLTTQAILAVNDRLTLLEAVATAARENRDTDEAYSAAYDRAGGIPAELCIRRAQTQVALMVALAALDEEATDAH